MSRLLPILTAVLLAALAGSGAAADEPGRPISLAEALRLARENNPDLATAQQRVRAARAGLEQTEAALWPRVQVGENYAASDNPVQAFMMTLNQRAFNFGANFNHPDPTDNLQTKVLAQWSLYDGGQSLASRQAARLQTDAAGRSLEAARNDLVFEVVRSYHTIRAAREFVRAAQAAVSSLESTVAIASNRFAAGQSLKTDLLDAQVRLAESRENFLRARNACALSETVFRQILGVGERENVTASESEAAGAGGTAADRAAAPGASARPELAAARSAVGAADRQVSAAQAGRRPRVSAFASYDVDSGDARRFEDSWVAGVSVELDVFDGFLTRGKVAEARARLEEARQQARKVELAIGREVRQAQLNLEDARARLDTTGAAVAQAEESVQIARDRYANGLALLTQLLDAETARTAARQRRAAAQADALVARAALDRALGIPGEESK